MAQHFSFFLFQLEPEFSHVYNLPLFFFQFSFHLPVAIFRIIVSFSRYASPRQFEFRAFLQSAKPNYSRVKNALLFQFNNSYTDNKSNLHWLQCDASMTLEHTTKSLWICDNLCEQKCKSGLCCRWSQCWHLLWRTVNNAVRLFKLGAHCTHTSSNYCIALA